MSEVATPPGATPPAPVAAPASAPAAPTPTGTPTAPKAPGVIAEKLASTEPGADSGRARDAQGRFIRADGSVDPNQGPETPTETARRHRLKDGDEEYEVDDDELRRGYQRARAANRRFEEAAAARKELEAREGRLRAALARAAHDPESALRSLGVDPDAYVQARLRAMVEEESLPDHERGRRALDRERAEFEAQRSQYQAQQERAQYEAQVRHHQETFTREIPLALKAEGLPDRGYAATRMVDLIQAHVSQGIPPDFRAIAAQVRAEFDEDMSGWARNLDDGRIRSIVGEERLAKIRAADLAKLAPARPPAYAPPPAQPAELPKVKWDQWTPELEAQFRNRK